MWLDVDKLYVLNDRIRENRVIIIKDYIVAFGIPDKWIEVMNLKNKALIFRVDFEPVGAIDLEINKIEMFPNSIGWNIFNVWLSSI